MKIRVIRVVDKLFITSDMPIILEEKLEIRNVVFQGIDR